MQCCPKCCGWDLEPGSVTYSFDPRVKHRPGEAVKPDLIERKFRCCSCDAEFHIVERPDE